MYKYPKLFALELKTHTGTSLPFSAIREEQKRGLFRISETKGVLAGLVIFFSDIEKCFFLNIQKYVDFEKSAIRKSISVSFCVENGTEIDCRKLKTNYRFDVDKFVNEFVGGV